MNWYLKVLKQYVDFSGRARRMEYWMFVLISVLISLVLTTVDVLLFGYTMFPEDPSEISLAPLNTLYGLAVLLPSLAVSVRRLHDSNRTGWWILVALIPLIGPLVLLVFLCLDGTPAPNRFGPDPQGRGSSDGDVWPDVA